MVREGRIKGYPSAPHGVGHAPGERRPLPFFFSKRFFLLFMATSILLIPVYFLYNPSPLLPLAADALLLCAALADFAAVSRTRNVRIVRTLPGHLSADKTDTVTLDIQLSEVAAADLMITDDAPTNCRVSGLPIHTSVHLATPVRASYELTPSRRGTARFGDITFWIRGRLGLVWKRGGVPASLSLKVFPSLAFIRDGNLGLWQASAVGSRPFQGLRDQGAEFDNLRDYIPGDDVRLVHWATSARRGVPVVRVNRPERNQTVFLVLDAGRMMTARVAGRTKLDFALDAALSVAYGALRNGDEVGVMALGRDVRRVLPPASTLARLRDIRESLHDLEPKLEEPRFRLILAQAANTLKRRALIVVFTDLIDERVSRGLTRCLLSLMPRHLPIVAAMSDPEVHRIADAVPESLRDLYRQGVASGLLDRKDALLAKLTSSGALVVDSPPDRLSADALNAYMRVKTHGLL